MDLADGRTEATSSDVSTMFLEVDVSGEDERIEVERQHRGRSLVTDEQSTYSMLRDQLVAEMIEFRSATHERDLIERMVRNHELVRRRNSNVIGKVGSE